MRSKNKRWLRAVVFSSCLVLGTAGAAYAQPGFSWAIQGAQEADNQYTTAVDADSKGDAYTAGFFNSNWWPTQPA